MGGVFLGKMGQGTLEITVYEKNFPNYQVFENFVYAQIESLKLAYPDFAVDDPAFVEKTVVFGMLGDADSKSFI